MPAEAKLTDQNFKPNFGVWYKKSSVTKEEFSLVLLGIEPELYKKSCELSTMFELNGGASEREPTPEETDFYWAYSDYQRSLPLDVQFGYAYNELIRLPWDGNKDNFLNEAYKNRACVHSDMYGFLESIKKKPFIKALEHFKNHKQYKAKIEEFKLGDVKREDEALALLLGLEPTCFSKLLELVHRQHTEQRSAEGLAPYCRFTPEEKWLFSEYHIFLKNEFPRMEFPIQCITRALNKAKKLNLWTGDFFTYAQTLFDNGFVFRPETFVSLEHLGQKLTYSADSWAIGFYKRYLRQGTWSLRDAACLYLGDDPREVRGFESLGNACMHGSGAGLALETAETVAEYDENDNFIPPPDRALKDIGKYLHSDIPHFPDSDLEDFVRGHIDAGNLVAARDEGKGKLYFKPATIVDFFKIHLPKTFLPEALFKAMEVPPSQNDALSVPLEIKPVYSDGSFITLIDACFLLATGRVWSQDEITAWEKKRTRFSWMKYYVKVRADGENWPPSDLPDHHAFRSAIDPLIPKADEEMQTRKLSAAEFLGEIDSWLKEYEALAGPAGKENKEGRLAECAERIKQAGASGKLELFGQPAPHLANMSSEDVKAIPSNVLMTPGMVAGWYRNCFWYLGEASATRTEKDWLHVTMKREQLFKVFDLCKPGGDANERAIGKEDKQSHFDLNTERPGENEKTESTNVFRKTGDVWAVKFQGIPATIKHSSGMKYIAILLSRPNEEIDAIDLYSEAHGIGQEIIQKTIDSADGMSRSDYMKQIKVLDERIEKAEKEGALGAVNKWTVDRDALSSELKKNFGLRGKARPVNDPGERARQNVTKAISAAEEIVLKYHSAFYAHLKEKVRTGYKCKYELYENISWNIEL